MKNKPSWRRCKCVASWDEGWKIYEEILNGYEEDNIWYRLLDNEGKSQGLFSNFEWCIQVARTNFGNTTKESTPAETEQFIIDEMRECERKCEKMYWDAVDEMMREIYLRHSSRGNAISQEELPPPVTGEELMARLSK